MNMTGPGSGNHWSDAYREREGNFMLMNSSTYMSYYGVSSDGYNSLISSWNGSGASKTDGNYYYFGSPVSLSFFQNNFSSFKTSGENAVSFYNTVSRDNNMAVYTYDNIFGGTVAVLGFNDQDPVLYGNDAIGYNSLYGYGIFQGDPTWDIKAAGGGGWLTPVGGIVDGIGGFGTGMGDLDGSYRLSKGGRLSPKYYSSNWTGGSRARITTYSAAKLSTRIIQGAIVVSAGLHVYNINQANIQDGRTFGYNTQVATAQAAGNLLGAWGGAETGAAAGAAIGVWFGGVGAVPGAIIGGVIGGFLGGWGGSELGGASVDWFY